MPVRTTIASLSGLAAGIACTLAALDGIDTNTAKGVILLTAVRLFPTICITLVAMMVLRRWMQGNEIRTRREYAELAERRQQFAEDIQERNAEISAREQRIMKMGEDASAQFMSLTNRLNEALSTLTLTRRELAELERDYNELAREHNEVVRESLQQRMDMFSRRARASPAKAPHPGAPAVPIPLRTRGMARLPEQPRHDRAAEDVGGHG